MTKFLRITFFILISFFLTKDVFAMDIPVFSLIVSENSSGYICSGDSIGCSSLSSIYKIEKRGEDMYVCPGNSIGGCSLLNTLYKTSKYNQNTTYICLGNSFGSCSTFNVLYKISKHDENTSYVCPGDSIGDCSIFNVLYKVSKYSTDTTFTCPGDSIGNCSIFNVLYKFKKADTQATGYSGIDYDLSTSQYTCPANSTLNGTLCSCNDGYISNGSSCITYTQNCQAKYGVNSYGDKGSCTCTNGYVIFNNQCILGTEYCRASYGDHTLVKMIEGTSRCDCERGYAWNSNTTACIKIEVKPTNSPVVVNQLQAIQKVDVLKEVSQTSNPVAEQEKFDAGSEPASKNTLTLINPAVETAFEEVAEVTKEEPKPRFFAQIFEAIKSFFLRILR